MAVHRRLAVDGRQRRQGHSERLPVDEWAIRMRLPPVGPPSSVAATSRSGGGLLDRQILDWMKKYAPPQAQGMTFSESATRGTCRAIIASDLLYTPHADMVSPPAVMNTDGTRNGAWAPSPHGLVLEGRHEARLPGRRSATLLKSNPVTPQGGRGSICSLSSPDDEP